MNNKGNYSPKANRRGFALIETLIAFVVLAVGLLALLSFYNESQKGVASAKAQAEASSLAEEKLQELESYLIVDDLRFTNDSDTVSGILGTYEREWLIEDVSGTKKVTVSVAWDGDQVTEVVSYIRNTSPHQDVANLLKVTANQAGLFDGGGGFDWGDGTGGDGGGDQGGGDEGVGNGDGSGGNGNGNEEPTTYSAKITGSVSNTGLGDVELTVAPEVIAASPDQGALASTANCNLTNLTGRSFRGFECTVIYYSQAVGWSGTVTVTSGDKIEGQAPFSTACAEEIVFQFEGVTSDTSVSMSKCK